MPSATHPLSIAWRWMASRSPRGAEGRRPVPHRRHPARRSPRCRPRFRSRLFRGHDGRGDAARLRHGRARRAGCDTAEGHAEIARRLRTGTLAPRASTGYRRAGGRPPAAGRHAARSPGARDRGFGGPRRTSRFRARRASRSFTTGDELVEPGRADPRSPGEALERLRPCGRARARGLSRLDQPAPPDREDAIASALAAALERHDLLVISGGVSAGPVRLRPRGARSARRARVLPRDLAAAGPPVVVRQGAVRHGGVRPARQPGVRARLPRAICHPGARPTRGASARKAPPRVALARDFASRSASPISCRSRSGTISRVGRWPSRGRPAGPAISSRSPARTASSSCRPDRATILRDSPCRSIAGRP